MAHTHSSYHPLKIHTRRKKEPKQLIHNLPKLASVRMSTRTGHPTIGFQGYIHPSTLLFSSDLKTEVNVLGLETLAVFASKRGAADW